MPTPHSATAPDFQTWALAVADVGTWRCSLAEGWVRGDAVMADMFGFTDREAQHGISFARLRGIIHPDDRYLFDEKNERVGAAGGYIVLEYRIVPRPGDVRWVLVRGRYDRGEIDGADMTGHGIAIDITATKASGDGTDGQFYAMSRLEDDHTGTLQDAADAAIALRRAVDRMGADAVPGLREAANIALRLIGRQIAGQILPDDPN